MLAFLPDTEVKVALAGYLDYVVEREKMTELFPVDNMRKPDGTHSIRLYL